MRRVPRTRRPDGIDEDVLKVLLDVGDELLDARRDTQGLDIGGGVAHDAAMARPDRAHDVLLEERDGVREGEGVSHRSGVCESTAFSQ